MKLENFLSPDESQQSARIDIIKAGVHCLL